jgi:hypothetical protein
MNPGIDIAGPAGVLPGRTIGGTIARGNECMQLILQWADDFLYKGKKKQENVL